MHLPWPDLALLGSVFLSVVCTPALAADPILGPAPQKVEDVYLPNPPGVVATPWVTGLEAPWS
ncbi:MAG: hypothetical protein EXQ91_07765, partial [Alphaproteobacteria bacterium]|nr:hypothetical protein [Alphaproteobacteria bacterium]